MAKKKEETSSEQEKLAKYIEEKVEIEVKKAVDASTKKLIRHKNIVIIKRDIIILLLIAAYIFLCYNLYNTNYFDKYFNRNNNSQEIESIIEPVESKETEESNSLIDEYSYLLDNFMINEDSKYIKDYYKGNLSDELRLYLSINALRIGSSSGEEIEYLDEDDLEEAYESIFKGDIRNKSFEYNDCKFKYLDKKDLYILDGEIIKKTNIQKEIINAYESNNQIILETVEGVINKDKLYNITTNRELKEYEGDSLKNYKENLTNLRYIFDKKDLKILSIEVIN